MDHPATVWAVRLERGATGDVKGSLRLEDDALVFSPADGSESHRIPLSQVRKSRRVRGSPILILKLAEEAGEVSICFYFTQPPPLEVPGRSSRRKVRRQNVGYLGLSNSEKKDEVRRWERAVREASRSARS